MIRRRSEYDPLKPTSTPRWLVVRTLYGTVLDSHVLPPGTDLQRAFVVVILERIDGGWQVGEFSSRSGTFFATRGTERIEVSITHTDPDVPVPLMYGPARGCQNCDD